MEIVVEIEGIEESGVEKYNSTLSSPRQVADPVVYKLVRVDGDGRFVPATDDEVMEVENSLEDDKSEMCVVVDTRQNEDSFSIRPQYDISEGLSRLENTEADEEKISARFEKFDQSGLGLAARLVKKAYGPWDSMINSDSGDEDLKARSAPEKHHSRIAPSGKDKMPSPMGSVDPGPKLGKTADSSADTSDDTTLPIPQTVKGGIRRKHHRPWTLAEVVKLVEGVAEYGAGRWSEIKRLAFASYSYRTSVDLKDKWRNLLKASFAPTPPDEAVNSRKTMSVPIPSQILIRVRELAEMHDQAPPPNLISSRKISGRLGGRSAPEEIKSGFL